VMQGYWGQPFFPEGFPYLLSLYLGPCVLLLAALAGRHARAMRLWALVAVGLLMSGSVHMAAAQSDTTSRLEVYGFGQADLGHDFKRADPKWFDVVRPTKLPSTPDEFGKNGNTFVSARQSRFGVRATKLTDYGDVKAVFDFDMFGVGPDAGQTTIRLRHAYGQFEQIIAGQVETPFMDLDVFPNILDYWGPSGMIFFRNVMLQWRPIEKTNGTRLEFALERPGASADAGDYAGRIELANVKPHFPWPDISGSYRYGADWGHVKLAGIWRMIRWDQVPTDTFDLSGHVNGWGATLSGNVKFSNDVIRWQAVYGEGIQNYFNDAPADVGPKINVGDPIRPIEATPLPVFGMTLYLDHTWNKMLSTAIGYSRVDITNSSGQAAAAFRDGQYASVNLLATPAKNIMLGGEFQFARRDNFRDGFHSDDFKMQFGFKYNFGVKFENGTVAQK